MSSIHEAQGSIPLSPHKPYMMTSTHDTSTSRVQAGVSEVQDNFHCIGAQGQPRLHKILPPKTNNKQNAHIFIVYLSLPSLCCEVLKVYPKRR